MDVKWIKICTNIFDDEKILLIESMPDPDAIITIWFKLLCLAGKQNNHGVFMINDKIPFTDEMFSVIFRRKVTTIRMALEVFENFGMIEIVDGVVTIPNWEKHQSLDALEKRRKSDRERQQKRRDEQRLIASKQDDANVGQCHVTVTDDDNVTVTEQDNVTVQKPDNVIIHSENRIDKNRIDKNKYNGQINLTENPNQQNSGVETVESLDAAFERIWKLYPRKQGKPEAKECFILSVKSGVSVEDIEKGVKDYVEYGKALKWEHEYFMKGSRFFREKAWDDDYSMKLISNKKKASYDLEAAKTYSIPQFKDCANTFEKNV